MLVMMAPEELVKAMDSKKTTERWNDALENGEIPILGILIKSAQHFFHFP